MQLYYAQTIIIHTLKKQLDLTYVMFRYNESHAHIELPPRETIFNQRVAVAKRLLRASREAAEC